MNTPQHRTMRAKLAALVLVVILLIWAFYLGRAWEIANPTQGNCVAALEQKTC